MSRYCQYSALAFERIATILLRAFSPLARVGRFSQGFTLGFQITG
jgi:hypothetical protein